MPTHVQNHRLKSGAKSIPIVFLTGGLGNQLFQIAQSRHLFGQSVVELDWRLGRPRLNSSGMPEIADFNLGDTFFFSRKTSKKDRYFKPSQPLRYVFNLYLRNSVSSNSKVFRSAINLICHLLWPVAGLIYCHKILFLYRQDNFFPIKRPCLAGYFQNPDWLNDRALRAELAQLKVDSEIVRMYKNFAVEERPLCVHMRMTDYRFDPRIGMISPEYFIKEVRKELARRDYGRVWLFSDEPKAAADSLREFNNMIRLIDSNMSSAETLELMKLCEGFVISNSTFSWWGAYLSTADARNITAPYPWFKGQESPIKLLPVSWQKSDPWEYHNGNRKAFS